MSEGAFGLLVLLGMAVLSAVAWHSLSPRYWLASVLGALTAAAAFQVANTFFLGYLDPFFAIAFIFSSMVSLLVCLLVGIPIRARRARSSSMPGGEG